MVIVNTRGERVLDTLIQVQVHGQPLIMTKQGKKSSILEVANVKGPSLESVQKKVTELISGRTVVGSHIKTKMQELGIFHLLKAEDLVDCSTMFNSEGRTDPQSQMKQLCQDHLNLVFAKKPFPYAVICL